MSLCYFWKSDTTIKLLDSESVDFEVTWLVIVVDSYWKYASGLVWWLCVAQTFSKVKHDACIVRWDRDVICNVVEFKHKDATAQHIRLNIVQVKINQDRLLLSQVEGNIELYDSFDLLLSVVYI